MHDHLPHPAFQKEDMPVPVPKNCLNLGVISVLALTFALALLFSPTTLSAGCVPLSCDGYGNCPYDCSSDTTAPHYYTIMTTQPPDWCVYAEGDQVWIHHTLVNSHIVDDGWYVVPGAMAYMVSGPVGWSDFDNIVGSSDPITGQCHLFQVF